MKIVLLHPEELLLRWSELSPLIQDALSKGQGENTLVDHMKNLLDFKTHCWLITDNENGIKGVILTEFLQYTRHKTLHVITLSGNSFKDWVHLYPTVEQFAKDGGAIAIEQWGRKGWEKVLPKLIPGFETAYVVMRKNIGD
jgi:hypothetical protein